MIVASCASPAPIPRSALSVSLPGTAVGDAPAVGISPGASLQHLPPPTIKATTAAIASAGATWLRIDIDWPLVEPRAGQFAWSWPDRVIDAAISDGVHVDALLTYTPDWAAMPDGSPRPSAFAAFARAAASRYVPRGVTTFEVWNEPNLGWGETIDPKEYVEVLRAGYLAIKAVSSATTVLGGSLARTEPAPAMSPLAFLRAMYADGAQGYFDALSVHPYSVPALPTQASPTNDFTNLPQLRALMVANADQDKSIWITEYGAATQGAGSVELEPQAVMFVQAYEQAAKWGWVSHFFWFDWRDNTTDGPYGLVTSSGQPKPALAAFESAAKLAGGGR